VPTNNDIFCITLPSYIGLDPSRKGARDLEAAPG
jgi:hypothetical protein